MSASQIQDIFGPLDPIVLTNPSEPDYEVISDQVITGPNVIVAKLAKKKFEKWNWLIKINLFAYCLGSLDQFQVLSHKAVYFATFAMSLLVLISLFFKKEKINFRSNRGKAHAFRIANWTSFTLFILAFALWYVGYKPNLYLFTSLGWATVILESCFGPKDILHEPHTVEILLKYILWSQIFFVTLNLYLEVFSWTICFFTFLAVAFMSGMLSIMLLVILISVIFGGSCSHTRGKAVICGTTWYVLNALLLAIWGVILLNIEDIQKGHEKMNPLMIGFLAGTALSLLTLLYTELLQKRLVLFLFYESLEIFENPEGFAEEKPELKFITHKIPNHQYLAKITSTYFSTLRKSFLLNGNPQQQKDPHQNRSFDDWNINNPHDIEKSPHDQLKYSFDDQFSGLKPQLKTKSHQEAVDLCFICETSEANTINLACGHGGMCYNCAIEGWQKSDRCSICRKEIESILLVKNIKELNLVKIIEKTVKGYADIEN